MSGLLPRAASRAVSPTRRFAPLQRTAVAAALCGALLAPAWASITTESEDNNTEGRADGPIASGVPVAGSLSTRRDVDWFYADVPAPGTVSVSLGHASGRDFDWALYPASGSAVATGASSAIPETGSYTAPAAGRYFVKVTAYSGSGAYSLSMSLPNGSGGGGTDPRPTKPGNLQNWLTGNAADSGRQPVNGPALLLMGGGVENDEAFTLRAFPVANGGDVVILRTSGSNGYNDYLYNLTTGATRPDSVETLLLDTRDKANSDYAEWVIRNAELVFIAGGDQSDYLNQWQGTRAQTALQAAYDRGAVVGGTSAGLAVQGEFVYDPDGVTAVTSAEAIANPYRGSILFNSGFLDTPLMEDVITDSHFAQRDRMGRLLAFMARLRQDNATGRIVGVGIDETTSLFVDRTGLARADGDGAVYVVEEDAATQRTQVVSGQPLVYRDLQRTRLVEGQTFHFLTGAHTGTRAVIGVDGRNATPFTPANPY